MFYCEYDFVPPEHLFENLTSSLPHCPAAVVAVAAAVVAAAAATAAVAVASCKQQP